MRRAQSTRNRPRPAGYVLATDELGSLNETEDNVEELLRRQLLEKDRENDKLLNQIHILQSQLQQRPPLETMQALREEHKQTEILLQGTQRENEKCLHELARSKEREKALERELHKLLGDNWQAKLEMPSSSPTHTRRASGGGPSFPISSSPISISSGPRLPRHTRANSTFNDDSSSSDAPHQPSNAETLAMINQMRTLILGMESRLSTREDALSTTIQRAEAQTKKFESLSKDIST